MKRIVITCDGTWNTPDMQENGVPCPTNVSRLAQAIRREHEGVPQPMFYHPGIGTAGGFLKRAFDGYTGTGISRNIMEAYRFVIQQYEPGDQLFLFGFSRGAFTVRSLAGLIRNSGLLRRDALPLVERAFGLYRGRGRVNHPREREAVLFRRTYAVADVVPIEFIGVWDTVGALGNPLLFGQLSPRNRFHDTDLSSYVRHAYHAVAIDEQRRFFRATLWHQQPSSPPAQVLEQVWFPGVHSSVGGGSGTSGLPDLALQWLADRARHCGLGIDPLDLTPSPTAPFTDSRSGFYTLIPAFSRPIDVPVPGRGPTNERLHESVLARWEAEPGWRPGNLVAYLGRVAR